MKSSNDDDESFYIFIVVSNDGLEFHAVAQNYTLHKNAKKNDCIFIGCAI